MYIYIDVFMTRCCWPKVWYVTPSCGAVGGWVVVGDGVATPSHLFTSTAYFVGSHFEFLSFASLLFLLYKNFPHVHSATHPSAGL